MFKNYFKLITREYFRWNCQNLKEKKSSAVFYFKYFILFKFD